MSAELYEEAELQPGPLVVTEGQNLMRASLFNLIVLSSSPDKAVLCQELIHIITEKFPCTIIFVSQDPFAQADFLHLTPSVHAVGTGENRVLCDRITIEASPSHFQKIP